MTTTNHKPSTFATCMDIVDISSDVPSEYCLYALKPDAIYDDYGEYVYARPAVDCSELTQILDVWIVNKDNQVHPDYCNGGIPVHKSNLTFPPRYVVIPFDEF